jgi:hypothetical protein
MGKVAEIKTKETEASVDDFINAIGDEQKRVDCHTLAKMMEKAIGDKPKMWGGSIIGFGNKRYKSPTSGREVDWFIIGFAPRKANLSLYLTTQMGSHSEETLQKLGKHKTGGGCLYINKLADVDLKVLQEMIETAAEKQKK